MLGATWVDCRTRVERQGRSRTERRCAIPSVLYTQGIGRLRAGVIGVLAAAVAAIAAPVAGAQAPPITDFLNGGERGAECPRYGDVRICSGDVPSFDGVTLDVDLTMPANDDGSKRRPLIVMLNGFGSDKHYWESNDDEADGRDRYHWNNHWFAKHGYYVLTYTPRGFGTQPADGDRPQTPPDSSSALDKTAPTESDLKNATIRLKSREFEIRDTQWLAALAARSFAIDPEKVAVTGNSYGGGESWTQASRATWSFPHEQDETLPALDLQVAVPKYGWTDLLYSLGPNGRPNPEGEAGPGQEAQGIYESSGGDAQSPTGQGFPFGVLKESYVDLFYGIGSNAADGNIFEKGQSDCQNDEEGCYNIDSWYARAQAGEPYEGPIVEQLRRGLTEFRSSYYQEDGWAAQRDGRKVAISGIQGWTDDLFPAVEAFRQFKYLKRLDPRWPVELMVTDVGHPRAQNKKSTWRRANQQAFQFLSAHIEGSHEQQTTVSSEPTVCELGGESDQETAPSDRLSAQTPEELSAGRLLVRYGRGDTLLFTSGADDPKGPASDPISATISGQVGPGECVTSPAPPPEDSYSEISRPLAEDTSYVGLGTVDVDYTFVGLSGQLDARVWDVPPDPRPAEECPSGEPREGCPVLITRGTYRLRSDRPTDLTPQSSRSAQRATHTEMSVRLRPAR